MCIRDSFQAMYYRAKQAELSAEIADIEKYLNSVNKNLLEDLCNQSMVVLKVKLARKYEGNSSSCLLYTSSISYCLLGSEKKALKEKGLEFVQEVYDVLWSCLLYTSRRIHYRIQFGQHAGNPV